MKIKNATSGKENDSFFLQSARLIRRPLLLFFFFFISSFLSPPIHGLMETSHTAREKYSLDGSRWRKRKKERKIERIDALPCCRIRRTRIHPGMMITTRRRNTIFLSLISKENKRKGREMATGEIVRRLHPYAK